MNKISLTSKEELELKNRGFFVKNRSSNFLLLRDFAITISIFLTIVLIALFFIDDSKMYINWLEKFGWSIYAGFAIVPAFIYSLSDRLFFTKNGVIGYGIFSPKNKTIRYLDDLREKFFSKIFNLFIYPTGKNGILGEAFRGKGADGRRGTGLIIASILPAIYFIGGSIQWGSYVGQSIFSIHASWWQSVLFSFFSFLLIVPYKFIISHFITAFHPLYSFGNIGEKIQKLTPKIEEKSKQIQSNFQTDMNFRVLSDGFDSLGGTFSEIISLVIKLEKVEQKANKGNLFDSEKYINSLRSDIIEPLKSLRAFLEKQREELEGSHEELKKVRVRAGGTSELSSESSLSSKRSAPLLTELTENIGKLDEMIGKMG